MKNKQIKDFEIVFQKLVKYANQKKENKKNINISIDKMDKYIEFIYKRIGEYCMSKKIRLSDSYLSAYVNVIYNSEEFGEEIYRIYCPWYGIKEFFIFDNITNVDCPTVNFIDVINYHIESNKKDQLKNIRISINELREQGLSIEQINNYIENILYKETENPKQKVKTLQK